MSVYLGNDTTDDTPFSSAEIQYGLGGDDFLLAVSTAASALYGGEGGDTLIGNLGADELFGERGNDSLSGGLGNDFVYGGSGNDSVAGDFGDDTLFGGQGDDTFVFLGQPGAGSPSVFDTIGVDRIQDFDRKHDSISFQAFPDLGPTGKLDPELFFKGKHALEADDRLGYDKKSGKLFFDENGSHKGESHLIAVFDKGTALKAADIDILNA